MGKVKKILITGGNGFVAKNLFEQLEEEHAVLSFNSKDLNLLDSVKVFECLKENKFDVIIHTANYDAAPKHSIKDPNKVLENNLRMFFNIVRCKDCFGKMIYFGSGAEFNREFWRPRMREDYFDQHIPADQYGFSKYLMTKHVQLSEDVYNLRLFGVFGKYDDWKTRIIPNACYYAIKNQAICVEQNKFYDFVYVNDLIRIVRWLIENKPKNKVFNICTGKTIDFKTIAEKVIEASGKKLDIVIKNEGLGKEYSGDNSLLMSELKDFEFTNFDKALKDVYDWYEDNKKEIFTT